MTKRTPVILTLAIFAIVFVSLAVVSTAQKSATWDEPIHLALGYAALTRGDYRLDTEHPPLLRLWAALPLLAMSGITLDTSFVDRSQPGDYVRTVAPVAEKFLYFDNDADRLLLAARCMVVLIGVGLGALVFLWAYEWLGLWPAIVALTFYTLEPNLVAHASLVTTDAGVTALIFGTIYFLWRVHRAPTAANLGAVVVCFALAIASKFSALILVPIVAALMAVAVWRQPKRRVAAAAMLFVGMLAAAWLGLWAVYRFQYAPSPSGTWILRMQDAADVQTREPRLAQVAGWIDQHRVLPNAYTQGFLFSRSKAQGRTAFLAGQYSDHGWWYYFPFAFVIKTPIAMLVLIAIGIAGVYWRGRALGRMTIACVAGPPVVYMAAAMTEPLNIGLRHILPVYPFLILLGAAGASMVIETLATRGRVLLAGLALVAAIEFAGVYPHTLTFFNQLVGGPARGEQYLVDSNLDWGQDLKPLKHWMDARGIGHINLAYFGTADPAYYHLSRTDLPGSQFFIREMAERPRLPGYVAVSATILSGVYDEPVRRFYDKLRSERPVATIGNSIHVYWIERPWW